MSKILDMRKKRGDIWDKAKAFLDERTGENGLMNAEDTTTYERMEQEVVDLGHAIEREERAVELEREMNAPVVPEMTSRPEQKRETKRGSSPDISRGGMSLVMMICLRASYRTLKVWKNSSCKRSLPARN